MKEDCGLYSSSGDYQDDDLQDDDDSSSQHHHGSKLDTRKSNKPIMEKRRRARINSCLNELKGILLEAMRKDPARHSKLEKADILELTVRHLQTVQRNQLAVAMATDPTVLYRFKNGFSECAAEVSRYLSKLDGVDTGMKQRVSSHLGGCVNGLQQVSPPVGYLPPRYPTLPPVEVGSMFSPKLSNSMASTPPILPSSTFNKLHSTPSSLIGDMNNNNDGDGMSSTGTQTLRTSAFRVINQVPTSSPDISSPSSGMLPNLTSTPNFTPDRGNSTLPNSADKPDLPNPLDYSTSNRIQKMEGDQQNRQVRVIKVEPIHLSFTSPGSSAGKDGMWRPW